MQQDERPPVVVAIEWVSRITTVALEMVLPGLAGHWLDQRWGTSYLTLVGFAFGLTAGIWHLLSMAGQYKRRLATDRKRRVEPEPGIGTDRRRNDPDRS